MQSIAAKIKATGRVAGLWLAPLLVGKSSGLYQDHPDWLLRDAEGRLVFAGFEFGEELCALDVTHPEAAEWLANLIKKARSWGYDYLKLDFLYAGALPGVRHRDKPREAAYRHALEIIRGAAGDAYLLACGCPILPSLGLCDAMRIGADVAGTWDSKLYSYYLYNQTAPSLKNAIRTTVNRLWLAPLAHIDPDVAFFGSKNSLSPEQKRLMQDLTEICNFKACSDLPGSWTESERQAVRDWLETMHRIQRIDRYTFEIDDRQVDFTSAIALPPSPKGFAKLIYLLLGFLGNQLWALRLWHRVLRYQAAKE
jgi:alpha-galactosidase